MSHRARPTLTFAVVTALAACPGVAAMHPRLEFAHGGVADIAPPAGSVLNFLSAPNIALNVRFDAVQYLLPRPRLVNGTAPRGAFLTVRDRRGRVIAVDIDADAPGFRVSVNGKPDSFQYAGEWRQFFEEGLRVYAKVKTVFARANGWEVNATRCRFLAPLDKSPISWLELTVRPLDAVPALRAVHGASTLGAIAPHGILGQSFDGDGVAVSGARDAFGNGPLATPTARAEGALEGSLQDYVMGGPHGVSFRFSRFEADTEQPARSATHMNPTATKRTGAIDATSVARTHYALAPEDFVRV